MTELPMTAAAMGFSFRPLDAAAGFGGPWQGGQNASKSLTGEIAAQSLYGF
jgi:hypothetical protein